MNFKDFEFCKCANLNVNVSGQTVHTYTVEKIHIFSTSFI